MYTHIIGIDTRQLGQEQVLAYLRDMLRILGYAGKGRAATLATHVGLGPADPLRFLLGAPDDWLTTPRQRFAEAVFAYTFRCSLQRAHDQWMHDPTWTPTNPRAPDELADACLDLEFLSGFGLTDTAWEKVFLTSSFVDAAKRDIDTADQRARAIVALQMFGFPDPLQFFARRHSITPQ